MIDYNNIICPCCLSKLSYRTYQFFNLLECFSCNFRISFYNNTSNYSQIDANIIIDGDNYIVRVVRFKNKIIFNIMITEYISLYNGGSSIDITEKDIMPILPDSNTFDISLIIKKIRLHNLLK